MNLIIIMLVKNDLNINGLQTRPRPLHLFLLVSAIGLLALAFVATTNRGWVYLDSVKTFQQAFLFLQQH